MTWRLAQLFYSFFKTLVGKEIAVELKNDVALTGTLHSVDQYLNVKLTDVHVVDAERYPQLVRSTHATSIDLYFNWRAVFFLERHDFLGISILVLVKRGS